MSGFSSSGSYGHHIRYVPDFFGGYYRLSWRVDRYYKGDRLRYPMTYDRDTDEKGARRFAKRWGVPMPEAKPKP